MAVLSVIAAMALMMQVSDDPITRAEQAATVTPSSTVEPHSPRSRGEATTSHSAPGEASLILLKPRAIRRGRARSFLSAVRVA